MGEWKLFERVVWKPPMRWRVRQAWNLIRRGRYNIRMHYKFTDEGSTIIWIDDEYVGEVAMGIDPDEPVWEGSQLENSSFETIKFTDVVETNGEGWEGSQEEVPEEQEPHNIYELPFYGGEVPSTYPYDPPVLRPQDITPVNIDLALGWKVLMILATFPWWYGLAHLIMVGW